MKNKYRIKPSWVGYYGTVYYALQVKKWFGWWTLRDLTKREAESALKELQEFKQ